MAEPIQPGTSDNDLVTAMEAGDPEALRILNSRYGRMLAAIARRFLSSDSDTEEIVADVLWQAWRDAKSFDSSRGSVSVWLVTLVRSRAIDRLRANKVRERPSGEQPEADPAPDPAAGFQTAERARIVRKALGELNSGERDALELAYFSDLPQSQIADKLGIPLGTAKTRIRGAMIKLRRALLERQR